MAKRTIVFEGDDILRKKAKDVNEVNDEIRTLLDDMYETMKHNDGVGLAAPQVGILRKVVVIELTDDEDETILIELINPEIVDFSGEIEDSEGCLSLPGIVGTVTRPERVKVRALDRNGEEFEIEGEGMLAKALCHELDHLEGILFIDKAKDIQEVQ